jgi:hypothetical protein
MVPTYRANTPLLRRRAAFRKPLLLHWRAHIMPTGCVLHTWLAAPQQISGVQIIKNPYTFSDGWWM